jgi:hypothetical protein
MKFIAKNVKQEGDASVSPSGGLESRFTAVLHFGSFPNGHEQQLRPQSASRPPSFPPTEPNSAIIIIIT